MLTTCLEGGIIPSSRQTNYLEIEVKKMNAPRIEADTHKDVLEQRERRKLNGRKKHSGGAGKSKQNTKWYDHWD